MAQAWEYDGVDLTRVAYNVRLTGAPLSVPSRRADNVVIPGKDGRLFVPKNLDQRIVSLGMFVRDIPPSGGLPSETTLLSNLDILRGLFARKGQRTLKHQMGGVTRTAQAEVVNQIDFDPLGGVAYSFVVEFVLADPLWRAESATTIGPTDLDTTSTNIAVLNAGTYEVTDAVITITGAITDPRLEIDGVWFEYDGTVGAGETLVVDVGQFTAELDAANVAGDITHDGDLFWLTVPAGLSNLEVTATAVGSAPNVPTVTVAFVAPYI